MSKQKQKGTAAETAVVKWLKSVGYKSAERRALNGTLDRGDISGIESCVIEVKNHARMTLSEWLDELYVEMQNDNAITGVVIHKRRGTTDVGKWYATMPVNIWEELYRNAFERINKTTD